MAAVILASWMSTVLPLIWLLLPESALAAAVLLERIDTVRPWFSSSVIYLS